MELAAPVDRGVAWLALWEEMLHGELEPVAFLESASGALLSEDDELLVQRVLGYVEVCYWRFLDDQERVRHAAGLERLLWSLMDASESTSLKAAYFDAFRGAALTREALDLLAAVWRSETEMNGLPLSERDYVRLASTLALHGVDGWEGILDEQLARIDNPDRKDRFAFVRPSLDSERTVRDSFFASLADAANREHEPWVLQALRNLHHPLRASTAERYIHPSLELLDEIQATGDIFFPKSWLDATLSGHSSETAAATVRAFLDAHPDYPARLRGKILQSADMLFRAAELPISSSP
jgi:aminopeptidase N